MASLIQEGLKSFYDLVLLGEDMGYRKNKKCAVSHARRENVCCARLHGTFN